MDTKGKDIPKKVEDLEVESVVRVLELWDMGEFVELIEEKQLDGRKLLEITEVFVRLWSPKANAKKLKNFIEELKHKPDKYLEVLKDETNGNKQGIANSIEAQYQTVNLRKTREQIFMSTTAGVEELLKKIVPAKSFLYRHQTAKADKPITSYVPMDAGATKKSKRFFRLSSYEYPHIDVKQPRLSRNENFNDRGYYSIKTNSKFYIQKTTRKPESRKYKSLTNAEDFSDKYQDDHFYEDLCYNDTKNEKDDLKESNKNVPPVKPCMVKIQELFNSFKLPFFKKTEEVSEREKRLEVNAIPVEREKEAHIYENSDSIADMYDFVHVTKPVKKVTESYERANQEKLPVEEYLEPVQLSKDYCDVHFKQKDDSILGYIMSLFENRFGIRRETTEANQSEDSDEPAAPDERHDAVQSCPDDWKTRKTNMADRPLPVPVENEPYYMNIERAEAENLLRGQPDGAFVLRPSSQPNHAFTLSVSCSGLVHNVGVRRRADGRLALGFARRGERSFATLASLLRHHARRRLLLVAAGRVQGATTLTDTPQYYQTPSNLPVAI